MDNMAPEVTIRISGHQKFVEPWMTTGIETSNSKCQRLYWKTLTPNCTDETRQKYRVYRNILNQVNSKLGKCKHKGNIIPHISVDGIRTYEPKVIANSFGKFYSEMGMNLTSTIKPG